LTENKHLLQVTVVTPEKMLVDYECTKLTVQDRLGQLEILPNHASLVTLLGVGPLILHKSHLMKKLFISNGYMEIHNNQVMILPDISEVDNEIDVKRAKEAKKRAQERILQPNNETDMRRAELALAKAIARIRLGSIN